MLDERLTLAFSLYDPCALAADIGTDHGYLPAALLQRGRCQQMILTDISPSALSHARQEMIRRRLTDRVSLRLGDGLQPLTENCDVISVMGMGGRTISGLLLAGADRLQGASLILSAHTDWPLIRQAVADLGYHIDREEPCLAANRFYLVIRARPGAEALTPRQVRLGVRLFDSASPLLPRFVQRRMEVLQAHLDGLSEAANPELEEINILREDLDTCRRFLEERT